MESKTLILALAGFGVAAYVAYQLGKGAMGASGEPSTPPSSSATPPSTPPPSGDEGGNLFPGLSGMNQDTLCRVAPSLCAWYIPTPLPQNRVTPLPVVPMV